jgi:hypothetical protein
VGDDTLWQYRLAVGGDLVAFCSALERGEGLCTHYGLYKGMPYELGLRDSQISELFALRLRTDQLLSDWELSR